MGGESVALADIAGSASTAVWSSTDATHWQPVESGTSTTFWPNLNIISLSTLRGRFVAVSEMNDYLTRYLPPVVAWTSSDGRDWQALKTFGPPGGMTCGGAKCGVQPSLAVIGDGHRLFAWSGGAEATASVSSDGKRWTVLHLTGDMPEAQATEATLLPGGVLLTDGATSWFGRAEGR